MPFPVVADPGALDLKTHTRLAAVSETALTSLRRLRFSYPDASEECYSLDTCLNLDLMTQEWSVTEACHIDGSIDVCEYASTPMMR